MRRRALFLLLGGNLVSACVVAPALDDGDEFRLAPAPRILDGQEPFGTGSPPRRAAQAMGAGQVDVVLDAGSDADTVPALDGAPPEEDPFIEDEEYGEPVDEFATVSVTERSAAIRAQRDRIVDDPTDAPDEEEDIPRDVSVDEETGVVVEVVGGDPLDDWAAMTLEERAEATRRYLEADDPRDVQPDGLPAEPADDPRDEPHSVLWYLDNTPPPSVLRFTETTPPESVLRFLDTSPPPTRLPAYDLQNDGMGTTSEEEPGEPTEEVVSLAPGIYVHPPNVEDFAPGAPRLGSVLIGHSFHVSVAVPFEQADPNGDGVIDDLTITFSTVEGEETVTLAHDPLQDTTDGLVVYRTATPIALAGQSQGIEVPGSVTGLDLDSYEGARTVTITASNQDFGAIDVYTNNVQMGIGMISDALDGVSNVLVAEIATIRKARADSEAMADAAVVAALDEWQSRVERRMGVVQRARTLLADTEQLPVVKLQLGQFYLERLLAFDENGAMGVAEDVVPFSMVADANRYVDFARMDEYAKVRENAIRDELKQGVIQDVLPAYLVGIYDQYNTWNVPGAFFWTVGGALAGESIDHFGREKSVTHAAVEMGLFVVMIKLPDAIAEWAAGGFGRLPSIGVPRFRGTLVGNNVLVPKRAGRLALETSGGTQAYPGSAARPIHSLPHDERVWWHGFVASKTPTMQFDDAMAATARELDQLDAIVQNAQRLGVPYDRIEGTLASARVHARQAPDPVLGLRNGISQVKRELVIHGANADNKVIVVHPTEMQEFSAFSEGLPVTNLRQEDLLMIQGIKGRAEFEARHGGKPMYSPDEVAYARELLQHGDELKNWLEFSSSEGGLRHMFDDAAIADLRTVFGGAGPPAERIAVGRGFQRFEVRQQTATPEGPAPPSNPFPPRSAEAARPLATLEEYRALVARQAAGEALDLKQIARPGIARVIEGRILIQQGSGRWENTRPNDWLDLFVDARAPLPDGAVVLQRGVSPELVRQANLLSSRGRAGSNPTIVNVATSGVPEFVRIRVRARDVQAPMSDVARDVQNELVRLAGEGLELTKLQMAMEPLSPVEGLALLRNEAARNQAMQTGAAPMPPPPPPPPPPAAPGAGAAAVAAPSTPAGAVPRLGALDQRVIQKGFKAARGEDVEWTPEELTRLQQIAFPAPGMRPSAIHRRLMPVAEQLGGRLETMRVNPDDYRALLEQADDAFLARQELDDVVDLARMFGVPEDRITLLTQGLSDQAPATALQRASRALLREVDKTRGIVHQSGVPDDYFVVTRMYVAARANGNRLLETDVAWLRERMEADDTFIQRLATREFEDAAGEVHTIMDPASAQQLESMYRAATGQGGTPISTIDPASGAAATLLGGPSGRGGAEAPAEVVILSTEGSTGPVMEAFFLNKGGTVRIQGLGFALEPVEEVDAATMQRIELIREAALQGKPVPGGATDADRGWVDSWAGASIVRVVLDAYCLEADLPVPTRGMLYRIADPGRQASHGSLRPILEASDRLRAQGALHPSNDPEDYFHSIRQWALWAVEKDMDAEEFEDAFVAHARRNIVAAGQAWNDEVEAIVRDYAPGRWEDLVVVLESAGVR